MDRIIDVIVKRKIFESFMQFVHVLVIWTVCYYHVTYVFQSESTLYSCLNVKELFTQNRRDIWSESYGILTHNHLVRKRALNHLVVVDSNPVAVIYRLIILLYIGLRLIDYWRLGNSYNCALILYKPPCVGFHILLRCNKVIVKKPYFKNLCSM